MTIPNTFTRSSSLMVKESALNITDRRHAPRKALTECRRGLSTRTPSLSARAASSGSAKEFLCASGRGHNSAATEVSSKTVAPARRLANSTAPIRKEHNAAVDGDRVTTFSRSVINRKVRECLTKVKVGVPPATCEITTRDEGEALAPQRAASSHTTLKPHASRGTVPHFALPTLSTLRARTTNRNSALVKSNSSAALKRIARVNQVKKNRIPAVSNREINGTPSEASSIPLPGSYVTKTLYKRAEPPHTVVQTKKVRERVGVSATTEALQRTRVVGSYSQRTERLTFKVCHKKSAMPNQDLCTAKNAQGTRRSPVDITVSVLKQLGVSSLPTTSTNSMAAETTTRSSRPERHTAIPRPLREKKTLFRTKSQGSGMSGTTGTTGITGSMTGSQSENSSVVTETTTMSKGHAECLAPSPSHTTAKAVDDGGNRRCFSSRRVVDTKPVGKRTRKRAVRDRHTALGDWMKVVDVVVAEQSAAVATKPSVKEAQYLDINHVTAQSLGSLGLLAASAVDSSRRHFWRQSLLTDTLENDPSKEHSQPPTSKPPVLQSGNTLLFAGSNRLSVGNSATFETAGSTCSTPLPQNFNCKRVDQPQADSFPAVDLSTRECSTPRCQPEVTDSHRQSARYRPSSDAHNAYRGYGRSGRRRLSHKSVILNGQSSSRGSTGEQRRSISSLLLRAPRRKQFHHAKALLLRGIRTQSVEDILQAITVHDADPNGYLSVPVSQLPWTLTAPLARPVLKETKMSHNAVMSTTSNTEVVGLHRSPCSSKHILLHPLHLAAALSSPAVIRTLLDFSSCPNALDTWQRTPLHVLLQPPLPVTGESSISEQDAVETEELTLFLSDPAVISYATSRTGTALSQIAGLLCTNGVDLARLDVWGQSCFDYIALWTRVQRAIRLKDVQPPTTLSLQRSVWRPAGWLKAKTGAVYCKRCCGSVTDSTSLNPRVSNDSRFDETTDGSSLMSDSPVPRIEIRRCLCNGRSNAAQLGTPPVPVVTVSPSLLQCVPESAIDTVVLFEDQQRLEALRGIVGLNIGKELILLQCCQSGRGRLSSSITEVHHSPRAHWAKPASTTEIAPKTPSLFNHGDDVSDHATPVVICTPPYSSHSTATTARNETQLPTAILSASRRRSHMMTPNSSSIIHCTSSTKCRRSTLQSFHNLFLSATTFTYLPPVGAGTTRVAVRGVTTPFSEASAASSPPEAKNLQLSHASATKEESSLRKELSAEWARVASEIICTDTHQSPVASPLPVPMNASQFTVQHKPRTSVSSRSAQDQDLITFFRLASSSPYRYHPALSNIWQYLGLNFLPDRGTTTPEDTVHQDQRHL